MGFLDKLSDGIANTTKDLGELAHNATDITKLQYDKKIKEGELSRLYERLGKKFYEENKDSEDEVVKEITATILRIKEISDELMEKKGGKACPKCGALVKTGSKFCSACGEKIDDIFEE
ncbi:zinc ribbon domain-containing protein [Pseudobutyrivibrio xylanivorans]|uniref:Zinc-ribbon domain-containing protein n=1 Tax=Pseudobutyrivibrio xylanivorans TaxID=185007 RepID=A0A5P6VP69_PSEXY|nr:zinc ribbon domain-containing protein [Pseudobutyrivibrio xylanivorans]QFJ54202.1 zinc-ribbon domain-containing protein [Pseudobutyrivibrio xylanivorans]